MPPPMSPLCRRGGVRGLRKNRQHALLLWLCARSQRKRVTCVDHVLVLCESLIMIYTIAAYW